MIYAIAPENCRPYLTAGKAYGVRNDACGCFAITDDAGDEIYCLWADCSHANGDWGKEDRAVEKEPTETLRDRFAMAALTAIPSRNWDFTEMGDDVIPRLWAECAYAIADAMMAARQ